MDYLFQSEFSNSKDPFIIAFENLRSTLRYGMITHSIQQTKLGDLRSILVIVHKNDLERVNSIVETMKETRFNYNNDLTIQVVPHEPMLEYTFMKRCLMRLVRHLMLIRFGLLGW